MVLYITGICSEDCFYCPLSEKKKGKDVIYANERKVDGPDWVEQVIEEARNMEALGTGITGGDPMLSLDRTIEIIRRLKEEFGKRHHVHLYTAGSFRSEALIKVKGSGLDEIRFHPQIASWKQFRFLGVDADIGDPLDARPYHDLIFEARRIGLSVGLEVPAVVNARGGGTLYSEGLFALLDYAAREGIEFVNINELEASHTNMPHFAHLGYELVGDSMAVRGSMELALSTMEKVRVKNPDAPTVFHVCSSSYKDAIQLRKRLIRTAERVAKPFEIRTEDGTLLRGVIRSSSSRRIERILIDEFEIPEDLIQVNDDMVLIAPWILQEIASELDGEKYISEVYPTWDGLEVERTPL